jgi:hypothetical protein
VIAVRQFIRITEGNGFQVLALANAGEQTKSKEL